MTSDSIPFRPSHGTKANPALVSLPLSTSKRMSKKIMLPSQVKLPAFEISQPRHAFKEGQQAKVIATPQLTFLF
jgi:hypothetical protein